jgi:hypothetical protein
LYFKAIRSARCNHLVADCPAERFACDYAPVLIGEYPPAGYGFNDNDQCTYGINDFGGANSEYQSIPSDGLQTFVTVNAGKGDCLCV